MENSTVEHNMWLHIPKCAGSYLANALLRSRSVKLNASGINSVYVISFPPDYNETYEKLASLEMDHKKNIRHVIGHMRFGLHNHFPGKTRYITVLRDPVERVISHYYYVRNTNHPLSKAVQGMSLRDYVDSGITCEVDNCQTRMLAGKLDLAWYGKFDRRLDDCDYASALMNLESFYHVGFQDQLDDTVRELNRRLGLGLFHGKTWINKNKNKPLIKPSQNEINSIIARNGYDLMLYAHCKKRFKVSAFHKFIGYVNALNDCL